MAASAGAIRAGGAYYELVADPKKMKSGLDKGASMVKSWAVGVASVGAGVGALGASIEAGLGGAVEIFRSNASEIRGVAAVTGISTDRVQELGYAFTMLGGNVEDAQQATVHMSHFLGEVRRNSPEAVRLVDDLGMSVEDLLALADRDPSQALIRLGGAASTLGSATEQMDRLRTVFGRSGAEMRGVLSRLEGQFPALAEQAHSMGLVMGGEDIQAASALGKEYKKLSFLMGALANNIGAVLAPSMAKLMGYINTGVEFVVHLVHEYRDWFRALDMVGIGLLGAGAALGFLASGLAVAGYIIGGISIGLVFLIANFALIAGVLVLVIAPLAGFVAGVGIAIGIIWALGGTWESFATNFATVTDFLRAKFGKLFEEFHLAWDAISNAIKTGNWSEAMAVVGAGLNLGWVLAINGLKEDWIDFKNWFLDAADTMGVGFVMVMRDAVQNAFDALPAWARVLIGAGGGNMNFINGMVNNAVNSAQVNRQAREDAANDAWLERAADFAEAREGFITARNAAANAIDTRGGDTSGGSWETGASLTPRVEMTRGTFSGSALAGLVPAMGRGETAAERTAREAERTATAVEALLALARQGGLVIG